jgi:hypothetical protein
MQNLFSLTPDTFEQAAVHAFRMQYDGCSVYRRYVQALGIAPSHVNSAADIPMLPISFFKTHKVIADGMQPQLVFESSGTSGDGASMHYVGDASIYDESLLKCAANIYGSLDQYYVLALLPHYLQRQNSSLVYMARRWMEHSASGDYAFYLDDYQKMYAHLCKLQSERRKTILLGAAFGLLGFARQFAIPRFPELIVIETGGMKGRQGDIDRTNLHSILQKSFAGAAIHSEYGMTELLSQAYSVSGGIFAAPTWMRIYIYDPLCPLHYVKDGRRGGIAVIDLANKYSCSFILTQDEGIAHGSNTFEVLGRLPAAPPRGCNMLLE